MTGVTFHNQCNYDDDDDGGWGDDDDDGDYNYYYYYLHKTLKQMQNHELDMWTCMINHWKIGFSCGSVCV